MIDAAPRIRRRTAVRPFLGDRRGGVLVEFALSLTLLVPLLLGGVELARLILAQQKMERVAASVADLNARDEVPTRDAVLAVFDAIPNIAAPFDVARDGVVVVSTVSTVGYASPTLVWQMRGGGQATDVSRLGGEPGFAATLPEGFSLRANETAVFTEVFFQYRPLFLGAALPPLRFYGRAVHRPRLAAQPTLS